MRVALGIEYDGSRYHGWQFQPGLNTVQSLLESSISKLVEKPIIVHCAGRTDTGVHALNQVVHFDCDVERTMRAYIYGVNSQLPSDISVRWAMEVPETFNARFSALTRSYKYFIYNHPIRPAHFRSQCTWHYRPLDETIMNQAAQSLLGKHDFTSFRSSDCQANTPQRTIENIKVQRRQDVLCIEVTANAFLHHMVRNLAGVLMAIGSGRQSVSWTDELLVQKNRALAGETAPPYGLYLTDVHYPDSFEIPSNESNPLFYNLNNDD